MYIKTRHLKIFISSKFIGMEKEREVLLKEVFLELKKVAKERDVEITEIDLRWGITQEVADSGKTVKVCLDEIERCKDSPICFLGIIGSEYGWTKWYEHIDKNLLNDDRYSWIEEYKDKSITELEIMSVLKRGDDHNKVLLYLKDDEKESEAAVEKLKKELIELSSGNENTDVDKYVNIKEFRKKVKDDLFRVFDELYPENEKLTEKEKLYIPHNSFARERQKSYLIDKDAYHNLTMFMESDYNSVLIYGKEGSGKSSLVANYFNIDSEKMVVRYYIKCLSEKNLKTIISELEILFEFETNIDTKLESVDNLMSRFLGNILNSNKPLILVIDGIDLLDEKDKKLLLYHLVEEFEDKNTHSKIIICSRENEPTIKVNQKLQPMIAEEKQELIKLYMLKYGKKLSSKIIDYIVCNKGSSNLYFLTVLLNEIRLLGNYDKLEENIVNYLAAEDTYELFNKVLLRFKSDYNEVSVEKVVSYLSLVRDGISEDELLDILNYRSNDNIVTRLQFSPLFVALEPYLVNNNGFYKITNEDLCEVVINMLLMTQERENKVRLHLAHFFWEKEGNDRLVYDDKRAVRETIYQVYQTGDLFKVNEFLLIPMTFFHLIIFDRDMLRKYVMDISGLHKKQIFLEELLENILSEELNFEMQKLIAKFISFDLGAKDTVLKLLHAMVKSLMEDSETDNKKFVECYEMMADNYQYNARKWGDKEAKTLSIKYAKKASEYMESSPLVLASRYYLEAKNFQYDGQFREKGLKKYIQSLKLKESVLGKFDSDVIFFYRDLGHTCEAHGLYSEADKFFTIAWKRSKVYYGELSEETYYVAKNIGELYYQHRKPTKSMANYIKEHKEKYGNMTKESLKNLEESYVNRCGWRDMDNEKFLEVSKLILARDRISKDKFIHKSFLLVAVAYQDVGNMEKFDEYLTLHEQHIKPYLDKHLPDDYKIKNKKA